RPKAPMAPGAEATFAYRQYWWWWPPERQRLAIVAATRTGRGAGRRRRFSIEFVGDLLADPAVTALLTPNATATPGAIANIRMLPAPERKRCRVLFELDPGGENACELRLALVADGKPVTETWLYRWTS